MDVSEHACLFPLSAMINCKVTQSLPPMFLVPSVSPAGFFFLVRIQWKYQSPGPLISCSTFSHKSLPQMFGELK